MLVEIGDRSLVPASPPALDQCLESQISNFWDWFHQLKQPILALPALLFAFTMYPC